MKNDISTILRAAGEFLALSVLATLVPCMVALDLLVFGAVREISVTELTQAAVLFVSASIFGYLAWKRPEARGFLILVAGFIACMLLRELDGFWDNIAKGFWIWPTLTVALAAIGSALFLWRETIIRPMAEFAGTKSYFYIFVGLVVVLVFSRVFGSGNLLWKQVLGAEYSSLFRSSIQEGIELLGYFFLTWGSCLMLRRQPSNVQPSAAADRREQIPATSAR